MGFAKEMQLAVEARFLEAGFTKKRGILWRSNPPEAVIFLGLGYATNGKPGYGNFFPVLGVRFGALYSLQTKLGASPASPTNANLSAPLIYLTPEQHEYEFRLGHDNERTTQLLVFDVVTYGVPFFERFASVHGTVKVLEKSAPDHVNGLQEFLPVANFSLGNYAKALEQASTFAESRDPKRGTGKVYHSFLQSFRVAVESQLKLS
jgi:hypothetical protein